MSALQSISSTAPDTPAGVRPAAVPPRRLRDIGASSPCPRESVLALLEEHAQLHPLNRALVMLDGESARAVTYVELAHRVGRLAAWLCARFPEGGERIAIMSESSPAWGILALATIASRNVVVPVDTGVERDTLETLVRRVRPAILACSEKHRETADTLVARGILEGSILPLEHPHLDVTPPAEAAPIGGSSDYRPARGTAVMAFTSGTTATPKAVEIGFHSLVFQIRALTGCFSLRPSDRLLSLLPMHHMLEFTTGFLCPLWAGAQVNYLHSLLPHDALVRMRTLSITRVVTVPAWLTLLKRALEHGARADGTGRPSPSRLRAHARCAFGADFEHFVSGGAPLADELVDFYQAVGAPVIQGYGLTETGPVVSTNTATGSRRGSVGRPLAGTETAISSAGEILVRGPHVATHYRLDDGVVESVADATGWFHTGDLGRLDSDGFLYVTGRSKTTIVLANGKNVQPEEIETRLQACDAVVEAGVIALGDGATERGEEICLVAVPAPDFASACRATNQDFEQAMQQRIRDALAALAPHKRPRRIILRDHPLPRNTAGKLRRPALADWAKNQIGSHS